MARTSARAPPRGDRTFFLHLSRFWAADTDEIKLDWLLLACRDVGSLVITVGSADYNQVASAVKYCDVQIAYVFCLKWHGVLEVVCHIIR
jgi:hypothetical protein